MSFRALIVSREEPIVRRFSAALGEIGVAVESVSEIDQVRPALTASRFEAVMLDCDLAGGIELVDAVRQEPMNKCALVFAFVTGHKAVQTANGGGANFVLTKPINWEVAKRALRAAHTMIIRERRQNIRAQVRASVTMKFDGRSIDAVIADISETGLAIRVPSTIETGTEALVQFTLPDCSDLLQCTGSVVWAKGKLVGFEFLHVPSSSACALMKWLDRRFPLRMERPGGRTPAARALNWGY